MAYDSQMKHPRLREKVLAWDDIAAIPPGRTRDAVIQARVNQDFFRQMVLTQFDEKCCITGLPVKELLEYHRTNVFRVYYAAYRRSDNENGTK